MNDFFSDPSNRGGFDAMYYWDQFHPIFAAVVILLVGWIVALVIAAGVKKLLQKLDTNHKLSSATGRTPNIENLVSKLVFWFVMILAVVGALNVLNISGVSDPFSNMVGRVLAYIPNLLAAVAVGFIGWIIARLVRAGLTNVLSKTELDEKLSGEVGVSSLSSNIGEIFYWLVLLLFLPIVLSILGLTGLLIPVQNMVNEAIAYLPNLFITAVIIFVGYVLAKIVRGIVEGLSNSLGLQAQAEKVGLFKNSNVSKFLGSFVFAIIIITTLIVAFEALGIQAISQPATAMLNQIMYAIPQIIAAGLILIVAYIVSRFVGRLVAELISGAGVDEIPMKLDLQRFLGQTRVSDVIGCLIVFFTMLFAVSEAANRLGLEQVSVLIAMFIQFGASILLGAVILVIGFWLANVVANIVQRGEYNSSRWLGNLVRILIMGLVIAMGLKAMGIADSIVNLAFGLTLGSVAVAFALAFGLGGRQPAERLLTDLLDKAKTEGNKPNPLHKDEVKPVVPVSPTPTAPTTPVNPVSPTPTSSDTPANPTPPTPPYSDE
ncbi:mechanosensitive ion channel [Acinetobacter higginsii]|uniref:mechanosensitive ion channel n=1 Tax=Acinetobacter higginsii TaxID=70347 RepID=UPI001F4A94E0|nr:mechanosensitive ion channel [Acinetobacter higginsii]MCH7303248.1 mechanosensitive ion channel [Acinetobacter higginsii]MCH7338049.1 mechanosensitive ion channel [Acinetobacter higginsii]